MDPYSIRQLANSARDIESLDAIPVDQLTGGQSLQTLSLQPPEATVEYSWSSGSLKLELGRRSVAGRAYLRIADGRDQRIHIVTNKLHDRAIDMDPREWRDRTIFHNVGVDSDRIEWEQGDDRLVLERDRRQWKITQPVQTRIDPGNRDVYLQDLGRAQATGFILDQPDDLARFGLANPVLTLSVTTTVKGEGEVASTTPARVKQTLLIGSRIGAGTQDRFGMIEGRPVVLRLSAAGIAALFKQAADLASPTASGVNPADVKGIVIRSADGEVRLEREMETWNATSHASASVDAGNVRELLDQLTQLRAPQVDLKPYPRDMEIATITLHGFDGKAIDTVRIAQEKDTGRWALENGDNVLRVFPAGLKIRMTARDFGL